MEGFDISVFDLIGGLPIHPLVVHGVVVLFPLFALYLIYAILKDKYVLRQSYILLMSAVISVMAFASNQSGEVLASRVGLDATHALYGKITTALAGAIFLINLAYWLLGSRLTSSFRRLARMSLIVLSVVSLAMVVLVGHSGATSVWEKKIAGTHVGDHPTE